MACSVIIPALTMLATYAAYVSFALYIYINYVLKRSSFLPVRLF